MVTRLFLFTIAPYIVPSCNLVATKILIPYFSYIIYYLSITFLYLPGILRKQPVFQFNFDIMFSNEIPASKPIIEEIVSGLNTRLRDIEYEVEDLYKDYYNNPLEKSRHVFNPIDKYIEAYPHSLSLSIISNIQNRVIKLIKVFEDIIISEKQVRDDFDTGWEDSQRKKQSIILIQELNFYKNKLTQVFSGLNKSYINPKPNPETISLYKSKEKNDNQKRTNKTIKAFSWLGTHDELVSIYKYYNGKTFLVSEKGFITAFSGKKLKLPLGISWKRSPKRNKYKTEFSSIFNFLDALKRFNKLSTDFDFHGMNKKAISSSFYKQIEFIFTDLEGERLKKGNIRVYFSSSKNYNYKYKVTDFVKELTTLFPQTTKP